MLHGNIRTDKYGRAKEKPFYVVSLIKIHCKLYKLLLGKGCPSDIIALSVYTVSAVVHTLVGKKHFQK